MGNSVGTCFERICDPNGKNAKGRYARIEDKYCCFQLYC